MVWIRLWSRCFRRSQSALRLQHDVATAFSGGDQRGPKPKQLLPRLLTLLLHPYSRTIELSPWILSATACICKLAWCCRSTGHFYWILPGQSCNCLVHLLQLGHVHCCWSHDQHEGAGGLPTGAVLLWLWYHGCLLEQRNWKDRCHDQDWNSIIDIYRKLIRMPRIYHPWVLTYHLHTHDSSPTPCPYKSS